MTVRVEVAPSVLGWATGRAGLDRDALSKRFPKLDEWTSGQTQPTFRQLEQLAKATRTPLGLFLLEEPPVDKLPVRDFRTMGVGQVPAPSPDLLATIADCERRQEWYRNYLIDEGHEPLPFVGSATIGSDPVEIAAAMHAELEFGLDDRAGTWSDSLAALIDRAEEAGILVMVSGVVGSNTSRKLDPKEFRGFALVDRYAPVVFINGSDTKAAQIFTLAHELAHVWVGEGGVDDVDLAERNADAIERWCNTVAAEFLVPRAIFNATYDAGAVDLTAELERLARIYKVSTLVVLRRIHDLGALDWQQYRRAYKAELERVLALADKRGDGGNWLNTQPRRVSRPFARALLERTFAGTTTYGESFRMLGTRNPETLRKLARQLGVAS